MDNEHITTGGSQDISPMGTLIKTEEGTSELSRGRARKLENYLSHPNPICLRVTPVMLTSQHFRPPPAMIQAYSCGQKTHSGKQMHGTMVYKSSVQVIFGIR